MRPKQLPAPHTTQPIASYANLLGFMRDVYQWNEVRPHPNPNLFQWSEVRPHPDPNYTLT